MLCVGMHVCRIIPLFGIWEMMCNGSMHVRTHVRDRVVVGDVIRRLADVMVRVLNAVARDVDL